MKMKRYEFGDKELTAEAFDAYSNSDFCFYIDEDNKFYVADNQKSAPYILGDGTLKDVEDFLIFFN